MRSDFCFTQYSISDSTSFHSFRYDDICFSNWFDGLFLTRRICATYFPIEGWVPSAEPARRESSSAERRVLRRSCLGGDALHHRPVLRLRAGRAEGLAGRALHHLFLHPVHRHTRRAIYVRCLSLARFPAVLQLYQAHDNAHKIRPTGEQEKLIWIAQWHWRLDSFLGFHELPAEEHCRLEHRKRAARLHRRLAQHASDVHQCVQLWYQTAKIFTREYEI